LFIVFLYYYKDIYLAKDLDNLPQARGKSLPVEMPLGKARDKSPSSQKGSSTASRPGRKEKKVKMLASPWLQKTIPGIAPGVAPG
jgi:hypothetical protein